jgi:hypothetical protein
MGFSPQLRPVSLNSEANISTSSSVLPSIETPTKTPQEAAALTLVLI